MDSSFFLSIASLLWRGQGDLYEFCRRYLWVGSTDSLWTCLYLRTNCTALWASRGGKDGGKCSAQEPLWGRRTLPSGSKQSWGVGQNRRSHMEPAPDVGARGGCIYTGWTGESGSLHVAWRKLRNLGKNLLTGQAKYDKLNKLICAPIAQLDRVFGYEPKGRGFESLLAHQTNIIRTCFR